jgi:hypothetical protein
MNNHVTPRSIAYAATQVSPYYCLGISLFLYLLKLVFSLNNSKDWKHLHAGFHYPSFYNFIADFFEAHQDPVSKQNINDLLQWWNRYVAFLLMHILSFVLQKNLPHNSRHWQQVCSAHRNGYLPKKTG